MTDVTFRDLSGMAEFRLAEDLQRQVWGEGDLPDPADLMMVIQAEGGLVGGAFVDGRLVGYVFGFPTRDPQVQHSHRLAVLNPRAGWAWACG
jgi:predicted GNAT superfamily acetyltransferase